MRGAPLLVRIAGSVRVVRQQQARAGIGHRDDVVCQDRPGVSSGRPEKCGQADRQKNQATHPPILTGHRGTVKRRGAKDTDSSLLSAERWLNDAFSGGSAVLDMLRPLSRTET